MRMRNAINLGVIAQCVLKSTQIKFVVVLSWFYNHNRIEYTQIIVRMAANTEKIPEGRDVDLGTAARGVWLVKVSEQQWSLINNGEHCGEIAEISFKIFYLLRREGQICKKRVSAL